MYNHQANDNNDNQLKRLSKSGVQKPGRPSRQDRLPAPQHIEDNQSTGSTNSGSDKYYPGIENEITQTSLNQQQRGSVRKNPIVREENEMSRHEMQRQEEQYYQWKMREEMEYQRQMEAQQKAKKKMSDGFFADYHKSDGAPKPKRQISREYSNDSGIGSGMYGAQASPRMSADKKKMSNGNFADMFNKDGSIKRRPSRETSSRGFDMPPPMVQQPPPMMQDNGPPKNQNQRRSSFTGAGGMMVMEKPYVPPPPKKNSFQNDDDSDANSDMGAQAHAGGGGHAFLHSDDMVGLSFSFAQKICGAAALFFFIERQSVPGHWRHSMTIAGLVTGVAFWNYCYMKDAWVQSKQCPRAYRYLDWFITVPMQVIEFWMILSAVGDVSWFLFVRLFAAAIGMLVFGYCGESTRVEAFNVWLGFGLGMACWLYIIFEITFGEAEGTRMAINNSAANLAFVFMRIILIVGWSLYPIGYVLGQHFNVPLALMRLNIVYNVADLVNKVAFGLAIYVAAMQEVHHDDHRLLSLMGI